MKRTLTIRYVDGTPIESFQKVDVRGQGGRSAEGRPDSSGTIYFEWDDNWIDSVSVGYKVVKADWSLGSGLGSSELELTIPRD